MELLSLSLNPWEAECFKGELDFYGYSFTPQNRKQHFNPKLDCQLQLLIDRCFPQIKKASLEFFNLDSIDFKELVYWLNRCIQSDECPTALIDILQSHADDLINSSDFLEPSPAQSNILQMKGVLPFPLTSTYLGFVEYYNALDSVECSGELHDLMDRVREIALIAGALEYCKTVLVFDSHFDALSSLRLLKGSTRCPFCLKELKVNRSAPMLVKSHVYTSKDFNDPLVNEIMQSLAPNNECLGSNEVIMNVNPSALKKSHTRHEHVKQQLEGLLEAATQKKQIRAINSAIRFINGACDQLVKYYKYYDI